MKISENFKTRLNMNRLLPISIFVITFIIFSRFSRAFLTISNMNNILELTSFVAIPALGLATIMLAGYFDLSFVGVIGIASVLNVTLVNVGISPFVTLFVTLLIAVILELINAYLIITLKIHPWLSTIATMLIYIGLEESISGGDYISPVTDFFNSIRFGNFLGVSIAVWITVIVWLLLSFIMKNTSLGVYISATGGNKSAATKAGINTTLYSYLAFIIMGISCWISSITYVSQLSGYPPQAAYINQLEVILSVFFGMALSRRGVISVFGAFLGALYVGFLANGLGLLGISSYYIKLVEGLLVVLVIIGNSIRKGVMVQLD